MKVLKVYPPNYPEIVKAFPYIKGRHGIVFAWSGTIYNPSGHTLMPDVVQHETIHFHQQRNDPQGWWAEYIANPQRRLEWECEAYKAQMDFARLAYKPKQTALLFAKIVKDLSGPMYGNLCSPEEARVWVA